MSLAAWMAAGLAFLKSLPDIIKFMYAVKGMVDQGIDFWNRREQLQKLSDALKEAHATGNTSQLEQFFSGRANSLPPVSGNELPKQPPSP